jgi:hypothetical protein
LNGKPDVKMLHRAHALLNKRVTEKWGPGMVSAPKKTIPSFQVGAVVQSRHHQPDKRLPETGCDSKLPRAPSQPDEPLG